MNPSYNTPARPKSAAEILAQLNSNLPVVVDDEPPIESAPVSENTPTEHDLVADAEEDYRYVRDNLKTLIKTASESVITAAELAADAEHPRAYEVLGGLIKHTADIISSLTDLQKERRKMYTKVIPITNRFAGSNRIGNGGAPTTSNTAIFVGSTTELQKFMHAQNAEAAGEEYVRP
jgi:hypothetical protein